MPVVDQLFRVTQQELPLFFLRLRAVVSSVAAGSRVATPHRLDEPPVADAPAESAVAFSPELPVPARQRQPGFHPDDGIAAGLQRGGDPAEGRRRRKGPAGGMLGAFGHLELPGRHCLGHGDGRVRQCQLGQAFTRNGRCRPLAERASAQQRHPQSRAARRFHPALACPSRDATP